MNAPDLDDLLTAAQQANRDAPTALLARVMDDALANQPAAFAFVRQPPRRPGLWARMTDALGGRLAVTGLGTAALAGLFVGFAQPAPLTNLLWQETPLETVDLIPSFDTFLTEG